MVKKRGNKNSKSSAVKKSSKKNSIKNGNNHNHPIFHEELTLGQRAADNISRIGGSWIFILTLIVILIIWMGINSWVLISRPFDPYPFILLNLFLSCLAAFQAPIILMSQNRQAQRDRIDAKYDHAVNRKAEREIQKIMKEIVNVKGHIKEIKSSELNKKLKEKKNLK